MKTFPITLLLLSSLIALSACGQSGPLYLPSKDAGEQPPNYRGIS